MTEIATKEQIDRLALRTREAGTEIVKLFGKGLGFLQPRLGRDRPAESYLRDKRRILLCAALYRQCEVAGFHPECRR